MNKPESGIDLDLIAAFLDNRLAPAERQRALRVLAQSDAAFEVFADALRVQAGEAATNVVPIRQPSRWKKFIPIAAAAVLLIAILPVLRSRQSPVSTPSATAIVAQLAPQTGGFRTAGGWEQRDWSVMRGGPSALAESARDFRLGVRAVDLQLALSLDDKQVADRLAAEMAEWIGTIQLSQVVTSSYASLRADLTGGQPRERLMGDASAAESKLGELVDPFWFGFGKWSAGAELAARNHVGAFFQSNLTAGVIKNALAAGRDKLGDDDLTTLRQAAALARPGVADEEFDRVRDSLRALIKRHGG